MFFNQQISSSCSRYSSEEKKARSKRMILDFVVRVCDDVLVDIIRYGKRLELSGFDGLEHIGHRFFRIIDRCFIAAPFVFFPNLDCTFSIRGRDLKTIIKCEDLPIEHYCEEIPGFILTNEKSCQAFFPVAAFSDMPHFVRLSQLQIDMSKGGPVGESVEEMSRVHLPILKHLAPAFSKCSLNFTFAVENEPQFCLWQFPSCSAAFAYFVREMLPLFGEKIPEIVFTVIANACAEDFGMFLIAPLVSHPRALSSDTVRIYFQIWGEISLPIQTICDWIHYNRRALIAPLKKERKKDATKQKDKQQTQKPEPEEKQNYRYLKIHIRSPEYRPAMLAQLDELAWQIQTEFEAACYTESQFVLYIAFDKLQNAPDNVNVRRAKIKSENEKTNEKLSIKRRQKLSEKRITFIAKVKKQKPPQPPPAPPTAEQEGNAQPALEQMDVDMDVQQQN